MIDYDGIGESLRTLIETNVTDFKMVRYEGDERDENFSNMPYCDVVLLNADFEIRAGSEYVVTATYICSVMALDLSSHKEAATIRNGLVKSSQETVKANPRFDTDLETSKLGPTQFANAKDDDTGAFMALATFEVDVLVFVDPL
jgi:hypothetical protein